MSTGEIVVTVVATLGGSSVLLAALVKWLADLQSAKIVATLKQALDMKTDRAARYEDAQFELYSSLWESLVDLQTAGETLWSHASFPNLRKFKSQLFQTQGMVRKRPYLLEDEHLSRVEAVFQAFNDYLIGKTHLLELSTNDSQNEKEAGFLRNVVDANRTYKQQYNDILDEFFKVLRPHLRRGVQH